MAKPCLSASPEPNESREAAPVDSGAASAYSSDKTEMACLAMPFLHAPDTATTSTRSNRMGASAMPSWAASQATALRSAERLSGLSDGKSLPGPDMVTFANTIVPPSTATTHYSKKQLVRRLEQSIAKRTTIDASPEGLPIGRPRTAFRPCPKRARGVLPTRAPLFPTTDRKLPGLPPR